MKNSKYMPGWWTPIFGLGFLFVITFLMFSSPYVRIAEAAPWVIILIMLVILFDVKFGFFISIKSDELCRTSHFFFKKCINIKKITEIYYAPTFIMGQSNRSAYIFIDPHDKRTVIEASNTTFSKKTLAEIISDLKEINPSIKLDESAEALVKKYANETR